MQTSKPRAQAKHGMEARLLTQASGGGFVLFTLGGSTVDVDVEKTRTLYAGLPYLWQRCACPVCRNFEERLRSAPDEGLKIVSELGVNVAKCPEIWAYAPGKRLASQRYRLSCPLVLATAEAAGAAGGLTPDAEDGGWERVSEALFLRFSLCRNGPRLLLDWELRWGHV